MVVVAQLIRVLRCERRGRGFDPLQPPQVFDTHQPWRNPVSVEVRCQCALRQRLSTARLPCVGGVTGLSFNGKPSFFDWDSSG